MFRIKSCKVSNAISIGFPDDLQGVNNLEKILSLFEMFSKLWLSFQLRTEYELTPLSSQPIFLKVNLHGKFLYRVSRDGLGSSEMCLTKPMDWPFLRYGLCGF